MRSKTEILKIASTLKAFSTKIKQAQDGMPGMGAPGMAQTLTPEAVQDIALEITQVAEVAAELANEIAEGVPAEEAATDPLARSEEDTAETPQIETAQDDTEKDDEKDKLKEQVANMVTELNQIKRAGLLEKLATKYASLFPKNMKEAKMNEILTSKSPMSEISARVQEASEIIGSKTMVKIAQAGHSIFDLADSESEEVNIASKI